MDRERKTGKSKNDIGTDFLENGMPFEVGNKVFIRTVTYHVTGKVERIVGDFVYLAHAAWIADSGRFMQALKQCEFSEVEPFPRGVWVNVSAITDWTYIDALPEMQK